MTVELLADIQQVFREEHKDKLPSKLLVKKLLSMEERPWAEYHRGKALTQNQLARMLKDFDVHTHQAKVGAKNLRHYLLEDLKPLFERYLKNESASVPPETTATPLPQAENPDTSRAAVVSGEVAAVASTSDDSAAPDPTADTSPDPNAGVADDETLPLPTISPQDQTGQGIQAGSEVAAQNKGKTFSFSRSSNQGGNSP